MRFLGYCSLIFLSIAFFGCQNNAKKDATTSKKVIVDKNSEQFIVSEVKKALHLSKNEKVVLSFHRSYLNSDSSEDAYVIINLIGRAKQDYINNSNPATFSEMGYVGNYNYVVPFNGKTKTVGSPYLIGSNGYEPVEVIERKILGPGYSVLQTNYRVRNAGFAVFLQFTGRKLMPIFAYKRFDFIGTDSTQAFYCNIVDNPDNLTKDLDVYIGELVNYNTQKAFENPNYYKVKIEKTEQLVRHYFYQPSMRAYAAMKE